MPIVTPVQLGMHMQPSNTMTSPTPVCTSVQSLSAVAVANVFSDQVCNPSCADSPTAFCCLQICMAASLAWQLSSWLLHEDWALHIWSMPPEQQLQHTLCLCLLTLYCAAHSTCAAPPSAAVHQAVLILPPYVIAVALT